jgi:glycosyltransferase involved in cell wall biosynthesis
MKPAVVHAHDLDTLVPGILLKWVTGAKLIFDSHEDYPAMIGNDLGRMGYWLALAVQTLLLKVPDIVIASNQAISRRLSRQVNSYVVENLVDLEWFDGASPLRMDWESARPVVVHAGAVQKGKGLEQLFQALPMMKAGVDVVVAGYLPEGYGHVLKDMCQERGIRVRFTGFIDKNLFPAIIRSSAIGLALLQPTPNNIGNLPNKLFEYMAGGLPVIASDFPLMHQIICKNECGLTVDPTSPQEIAEAVDYLIFHPAEARRLGSNGRKIVEEQYSWTQGEQVLLRAYAALCTQRSSLATASSSW